MSQTPTILIVPGWRDSGPGHWQSLWADALPGAVRVVQALKSYAKYFRHPGFKAAGAEAGRWAGAPSNPGAPASEFPPLMPHRQAVELLPQVLPTRQVQVQ